MTDNKTGWLPMESAPKDGEKILVSWRGFCVKAKWFKDNWWGLSTADAYLTCLNHPQSDGWQPLPTPLKEGEKRVMERLTRKPEKG